MCSQQQIVYFKNETKEEKKTSIENTKNTWLP